MQTPQSGASGPYPMTIRKLRITEPADAHGAPVHCPLLCFVHELSAFFIFFTTFGCRLHLKTRLASTVLLSTG